MLAAVEGSDKQSTELSRDKSIHSSNRGHSGRQPTSTYDNMNTAAVLQNPQPEHLTPEQEQLAKNYLPLVKSIVSKFRNHLPTSLEMEDVYGIGIYGLMVAVKHYDPSKGRAFGAYAALRIRGAILDELRRLDWMPRKLRGEAKKLQQVRNELEQTLGGAVTDKDMSREMGMKLDRYRFLKEKTRPVTMVHLDDSSRESEESGPSLQNIISDLTQLNARERVEEKEVIERIRIAIMHLPEMSKKVVAMYYYENMRLSEIAAVFSLSESRICQIHSKAIQDIRVQLQKVA